MDFSLGSFSECWGVGEIRRALLRSQRGLEMGYQSYLRRRLCDGKKELNEEWAKMRQGQVKDTTGPFP